MHRLGFDSCCSSCPPQLVLAHAYSSWLCVFGFGLFPIIFLTLPNSVQEEKLGNRFVGVNDDIIDERAADDDVEMDDAATTTTSATTPPTTSTTATLPTTTWSTTATLDDVDADDDNADDDIRR